MQDSFGSDEEDVDDVKVPFRGSPGAVSLQPLRGTLTNDVIRRCNRSTWQPKPSPRVTTRTRTREDEDDVRRRTRRRTTTRRRMSGPRRTSPTAALVRKICPKISLWYLIRLEMIASHHVCRIASDLRRACSGSASTSRPTRPRRSGRPRDENPRVIGPNADSVLDTALYGRAGRIRDSSDAIV